MTTELLFWPIAIIFAFTLSMAIAIINERTEMTVGKNKYQQIYKPSK